MRYIFENENALALYCHITKELDIEVTPRNFDEEVYISEKFMMECLKDIVRLDRRFK